MCLGKCPGSLPVFCGRRKKYIIIRKKLKPRPLQSKRHLTAHVDITTMHGFVRFPLAAIVI
jgi:hypothetical protein